MAQLSSKQDSPRQSLSSTLIHEPDNLANDTYGPSELLFDSHGWRVGETRFQAWLFAIIPLAQRLLHAGIEQIHSQDLSKQRRWRNES
jgi:hypothetical protein